MLGYSQIPEHIFYNAKILTVDANFTVAEAIAIDGERIDTSPSWRLSWRLE